MYERFIFGSGELPERYTTNFLWDQHDNADRNSFIRLSTVGYALSHLLNVTGNNSINNQISSRSDQQHSPSFLTSESEWANRFDTNVCYFIVTPFLNMP
jgi:hypothetical protein